LIHPAEPDRDLGRYRSLSAAAICTLLIGSWHWRHPDRWT
jgi:hypothetical protein